MVTEDRALDDLLYRGLVDWVSLHDVVWYGTHGHINAASQALAMSVLRRLFTEELMVPGDLGEAGFEDWSGSRENWLDRAHAQLEELSWAPMGDGLWLRLTERGKQRAKATS
jgi:hypothetical protein